ncbi:MAG: Rieske 2Fe-2S domain-containing protein [Deltaproteobacteria bacterium]|nr:Rieske 2Fe-2S domain-containing protein [Deltaproteobacteria bacterium]
MAITKEMNDFLTKVGPGEPAGELLRRYWHPVAVAKELTDENPTKFVRVLGENLVLFRDKKGRVGLLEDRCSHRGASLVYGRVEERGIACAYHGWLYDVEGNCLETPPEPAESKFRLTIKQKSYPVRKLVGLYWAYMGPQPAPEIPKYDTLFRTDGNRKIVVHPQLDCNWLQAMENSVDPSHLQVLHQEFAGRKGRAPESTTRGFTDDVEYFKFYTVPYGIVKERLYKNGMLDEHPLIFPNILRQGPSTQIRVPIDDEHTMHIHVMFRLPQNGEPVDNSEDPPVEYKEPYRQPADKLHPNTKYTLHHVIPQDHMAWETQGPVADRTRERLATADGGIVMLREMLKANIERVQAGLDPINGFTRDPNHPIIDTNIDSGLEQTKADRAPDVKEGGIRALAHMNTTSADESK